MIRLLVATLATCLLTSPSSAQSAPGPGDCDQIKQAVATYGYVAAKRYALIHYGKDAARYGDKCLTPKEKLTRAPH